MTNVYLYINDCNCYDFLNYIYSLKEFNDLYDFTIVVNKNIQSLEEIMQMTKEIKIISSEAETKIRTQNDIRISWKKEYINTNILVINNLDELKDIMSFYSKYDYKTLDKK